MAPINRRLVRIAVTLAAFGALSGAVGTLVVVLGVYDIGATTRHTQPVFSLLDKTLSYAVRRSAADVKVPPLDDPRLLVRGAACFRDHCVQCHGGPGVAPEPFGLSMQPLPGPLVDAARRWHEREIYWITRNGIRMSGMPAWEVRLSEDDLWAVTAFVAGLPAMSPPGYEAAMDEVRGQSCPLQRGTPGAAADRAMPPAGPPDPAPGAKPPSPQAPPEMDPERARLLLHQYACVSCHRVPGVTGPNTLVGPPLEGMARRRLIAGRLTNTPENMVRWLQDPQGVKPGTAMPALGITDEHARLMAAYLSRSH
jgi:mono/diheme cytochrome c family protein